MMFAIAVKAFIISDDKLLIVKRASNDVQKPNAWEIPGGRLNAGEDPKSGLVRESKEETGLDVKVLHPMNVQHFTRDDGQVITMIIFLCKPSNDKVVLSREHSEYEWIKVTDAKSKLISFFHGEVDIYKKLSLDRLL